MAILRRFTPQVEPISIDEAFLDVTGSRAAVRRRARRSRAAIKAAVRDEVGLTASVGVATTKLVAKIASDLRKPDGLVVVPPGDEAAFLAPLPISRLWGVGEKTAARPGRVRRARRSATSRRCRRTSSSAGSASTAASLVDRARGHRRRPGPRGRPGQVGRPRAHVRRRHVRPGGHRADAARAGRRRRRPAALGRRPGLDDRGQDPRLVVPDDHPPADAARADRPDRADLPGRRWSSPGRRSAASASGCSGSRPRTSASASSSGCSRPRTRVGGRRSRRPTRVRRRYGSRRRHARPAGRQRACRRRSSATRATRSIGGRGACRSTASTTIPTGATVVTA